MNRFSLNLSQIILSIALALCCIGILPTIAVAQNINETMQFTGVLNSTTGTAQSGTFDMVFRFYDAPTGGTLLDTSTHTAGNGNPVTVTNGEFSVQLGSGAGNTLDGIDFNTDTIYVGLTVGADSEMTPRTRLTAAPYSFNADRLDGYDSTDFLRTTATNTIATSSADTILTVTQSGAGNILDLYSGATNVLTVTSAGNVGIGTSSPTRTLTVDGDMELAGALYDSLSSAGTANYVLRSTGSGVEWVATSSLNIVGGGGGDLFTDGGLTTYLTSLTDSLAIGTTTSVQALRISYLKDAAIEAGELLPNDFSFSADGTKVFLVGSERLMVYSYDLSVPYDITTSISTPDEFFVGNLTSFPSGVVVSADGLKLFVFDNGSNRLFAFDLSVANDITTATYTGEQLVLGQFGYGNDIVFNADGSKLFYVYAGANDRVIGLDLSVPYDLTTAVYSGEVVDITIPNNNPSEVTFNADGTKMYTARLFSTSLYAHDLGVPYDVSTAVYSGETITLSTALESFIYSIQFNPAGTEMTVLGYNSMRMYRYALSVPFDISTATYLSEGLAVGTVGTVYRGLALNSSGDTLYALSTSRFINVFELDSAHDLSTARLSGEYFRVTQDTLPTDLEFNDTGSKMFVLGQNTRTVYAYDVSTSFDVRTATHTGEVLAVGARDTIPTGIEFNDDGTKLFLVGDQLNQVVAYDLVVPYDLLTATATAEQLIVTTQESNPQDIVFSASGTVLHLVGPSSDRFSRYELSVSYDLSSATFDTQSDSFWSFDSSVYGVASGPSESTFYILGDSVNRVYLLDLSLVTDRLTVADGSLDIDTGGSIAFGGVPLLTASSSNRSLYFGESAGLFSSGLATDNIFIGYEAGMNASSSNHDSLILIGYQAGRNLLSSSLANTIGIGYQAGYEAGGEENIYLSSFAGFSNTGNYNTLIGYRAGYANTGDYNILLGYEAGASNSADFATLIGVRAGEFNIGNHVIAAGSSSAQFNQGDFGIFLGYAAGQNNTGDHVVALSQYAGQNNIAPFNVFVGRYAGSENTGPDNVIIGHEAGRFIQSTSSVLLGAWAMSGSSTYQAENNVAIGYRAGASAQSGASNNVLIGYHAADNLTTGSNNIVIGYDIDVQDPTQSNTLNIANLIFGTGIDGTGTTVSTGNIGIGTSTPTAQLHTTGTLRFSTFGAGTLQTDASGNVSVSSDERLKDIEAFYTDSIDALMGIEPIVYRWNEASGFETLTEYIGFSAQNVKENIPGAVGEDGNGFLTLSDRGILATVVNAVKQIWLSLTASEEMLAASQAELNEVTEQLEEMQEQINEYTLRIERLRAEVGESGTPQTAGESNEDDSTTNESVGEIVDSATSSEEVNSTVIEEVSTSSESTSTSTIDSESSPSTFDEESIDNSPLDTDIDSPDETTSNQAEEVDGSQITQEEPEESSSADESPDEADGDEREEEGQVEEVEESTPSEPVADETVINTIE